MDRASYTYKVGQQVFYFSGGRERGNKTGPYTVVGIERQLGGGILYRIRSRSRQRLAYWNELKLDLARKEVETDAETKGPEPLGGLDHKVGH